MALIAEIASLLEARWKDCCRRYYFTVDDSRSLRHNEGDDGVISSVPRRRHVNPTSNPIRSAAAAAAGVDNENYGRPTMGSMRQRRGRSPLGPRGAGRRRRRSFTARDRCQNRRARGRSDGRTDGVYRQRKSNHGRRRRRRPHGTPRPSAGRPGAPA